MFDIKTVQMNVMFRAEKSGQFRGTVSAVLSEPDAPTFDVRGEATCYAHAGQHSTCHVAWFFRTRAAKPHEYAALQREMESIGYALTVRKKRLIR